MNKVLVISPHPDDETLGCGGTLLHHSSKKDILYWHIMTRISKRSISNEEIIKSKKNEIEKVNAAYKFREMKQEVYEAAFIDNIQMNDLVNSINTFINKIRPNVVYIPFGSDIHTDHQIIFKASIACLKSFRNPFVESIRVYETISETHHYLDNKQNFNPNLFVDISKFINKKIRIMNLYKTELQKFPSPRNEKTIRALSNFRGSSVGFKHAEAFMSLRELLK